MRIFVAVNQISEIGFRQTTALLIAALVRRGCLVSLANVDDFSAVSENRAIGIQVQAIRVPESANCDSTQIEAFVQSAPEIGSEHIRTGDLILIRTNPGRDSQRAAVHDTFLEICRAAQAAGVCVVNDPANLKYFASKASLAACDPRFIPPLIVSSRKEQVAAFVRSAPADCVLKPLFGSRGQNVIRVNTETECLEQLIEKSLAGSAIIAQHFVYSDHSGDKRIVTVGGRVLEIDRHIGGIERRPADGDFRANLHAGGTAHPVTLDDRARTTAEYAARLLNENGILIAGVDLIGDKIIEFNVFSTGGIYDAEIFSGLNFSDSIVDSILDAKFSNKRCET